MKLVGASPPWASGGGNAAPLPLFQLIAQRWGDEPEFCLLNQHWEKRGRRLRLHRLTSYRVGAQPVSWHLAVVDPFRLPFSALVSLLAGSNLGEVMVAMGWEREGLKAFFRFAPTEEVQRPFAGLALASLFPGWVRTFRLPMGSGQVWEFLPQRCGWGSGEEI